jgi:hypothetical protein
MVSSGRLHGHAGKIRETIELPGKYRRSLNGTVTISGEASFSFTLHDGYSRLFSVVPLKT